MKALLAWVKTNIALSLLLGLEMIGLLIGFFWILSLTFKTTDKLPTEEIYIPQTHYFLLSEESQKEFAELQLQMFKAQDTTSFRLINASRAELIEEFESNENTLLILSEPLNEKELKSLDIEASRLPIQQLSIDHTAALPGEILPVLIMDNQESLEEQRLRFFLLDNATQDIVYEKRKQKNLQLKTIAG